VTAGSPLVLDPEKVRDLEAGVKSTFLNGRLIVNANVYTMKLTGLQANIYPTNGAKSYLANVGDVRAKGVEGEVAWNVDDHLTLSANGSYASAKYTDYPNGPCPVGLTAPCNLTGKPLYQAPKWVGSAQALYETELANGWRPFGLLQLSYRSSIYGSVDDAAYSKIKGYALVNARLGTRIGRYEASAWVNNLFDKTYLQTLGAASIPGAGAWGVTGQLGAPRTWGVTLRAEY